MPFAAANSCEPTVPQIVKPFTRTNNSNGVARESLNERTLHASEVPDILEARSNLRYKRTNLLQSEVDIQTQALLKYREEFMNRLKQNSLQDYAKSIFPSTGDPRNYYLDAPEEIVPRQLLSLHAALMATPAKQSKATSITSNQRHEDTTIFMG